MKRTHFPVLEPSSPKEKYLRGELQEKNRSLTLGTKSAFQLDAPLGLGYVNRD